MLIWLAIFLTASYQGGPISFLILFFELGLCIQSKLLENSRPTACYFPTILIKYITLIQIKELKMKLDRPGSLQSKKLQAKSTVGLVNSPSSAISR